MLRRLLLLTVVASSVGCYSTDNGVSPPEQEPNFPVGLAVSPGGSTLYVANSNFDLQFEAGTLQAFDLGKLRRHALILRDDPTGLLGECASEASCPYVSAPSTDPAAPGCADAKNDPRRGVPTGSDEPGLLCVPPMKAAAYHRSAVRIGAFASDLQLSLAGFSRGGQAMRRLFVPVRGNASVTWLDVPDDAASPGADAAALECGQQGNANTCNAAHQAGNRSDEPGNTRNLTLPGEPYGLAQSSDGRYLVLTHQTTEQLSLLDTGLPSVGAATEESFTPSLQFVTDGVPNGGNGIATIPYSADAYLDPAKTPRPGFLMTSRSTAEVSLVRFYSDQGISEGSSLARPYLVPEDRFAVNANPNGVDSRGIVIDPSRRIQCAASLGDGASAEALRACARQPARVFIANRSPSSLLVAELGERSASIDTDDYAADSLQFVDALPVPSGVSRLYLAPIVDRDGRFAMRLFVVCFDSAAVAVFDPETLQLERVIRVGRGPYAMTFDPFDFAAAARHDTVPAGADGTPGYRLGYVASFTDSFVQALDLDRSDPSSATFERVVFSLGVAKAPKSQEEGK